MALYKVRKPVSEFYPSNRIINASEEPQLCPRKRNQFVIKQLFETKPSQIITNVHIIQPFDPSLQFL